ncbi:MAG: hypothetical protein PGN29_06375 [Gordonia paraffinivorans]
MFEMATCEHSKTQAFCVIDRSRPQAQGSAGFRDFISGIDVTSWIGLQRWRFARPTGGLDTCAP